MRILVVCGAGASSTFVAQRLRTAAAAAGLDWEASAGAQDSAAADDADLVLVGPHLADRFDDARAATARPVVMLPADVFGDLDGTRTLALARAALDAAHSPDSPSPAKGTS